jgi:carboxypeptidase family protein
MRYSLMTGIFVVSAAALCGCGGSPTAPDTNSPPPVAGSAPNVPRTTQIVTGVVRNEINGDPIAGVAIEWTGLAEAWGDRGHGVKTDQSGRYELPVGPLGGPGSGPGTFMMKASKDGYDSVALQVTFAEHTEVNFNLTVECRPRRACDR